MMEGRPPPAAVARQLIALALHMDGVTAEVVDAFRAVGIRSVLLKGPALAAWLYQDRAPRPYVDADLLVAPDQVEHAGEVLRRLGFDEQPDDAPHSRAWVRRRDGGQVDLHAVIAGMIHMPADTWREVTATAEPLDVGGTTVEVPAIPVRAMIVALHAAHHRDAPRPLEDLARAVEVASRETWREAVAIADRLGATGELSVGLRLIPAGNRLANELGLPSAELVAEAKAEGSRAQIAIGLDRLASSHGLRGKLQLLAAEALPTAEFMRLWSPLARRGRLGLTVAYPMRIGWLLWHAGPSLRAWRRSRAAPAEPRTRD